MTNPNAGDQQSTIKQIDENSADNMDGYAKAQKRLSVKQDDYLSFMPQMDGNPLFLGQKVPKKVTIVEEEKPKEKPRKATP